jgi:hypothetical protein
MDSETLQEEIAHCVQLCESTQNPAALLWILPMDFKICVQYARAFPEFVNFMTQFEKCTPGECLLCRQRRHTA